MNRLIDHTLLKATATEADIEALPGNQNTLSKASASILFLKKGEEFLADSGVLVCTVVGFRSGECDLHQSP